jgi:hypothetical protein
MYVLFPIKSSHNSLKGLCNDGDSVRELENMPASPPSESCLNQRRQYGLEAYVRSPSHYLIQ